MVAFEPHEQIKIGDVFLDEEENEFNVAAFETMRFAGNIPEWYLKLVSISIIGESYSIGEYLCKK